MSSEAVWDRTFWAGGNLVQGQRDGTLPNMSQEKGGGSVAGAEQAGRRVWVQRGSGAARVRRRGHEEDFSF